MSKPGDPRIGDLLTLSKSEINTDKTKVAILGYPCDIGVQRSKGRVGAKRGPEVVRAKLQTLGAIINPEFGIDIRNLHLVDRGDVDVCETLEETHVNLISSVQSIMDDGFIGIIIGGGHDQSYCNLKGLMNSLNTGNVGVVNVDAHLDVRPFLEGNQPHSGSSYYQLMTRDDVFIKDGGAFYEFAVQGSQSSAEHAKLLDRNNCGIVWLSQLRRSNIGVVKEFEKVLDSFGDRSVFMSVDMDVISSSDSPGVSTAAVVGLTAQEALDICFTAGKYRTTKLIDISEFNPDVEEYRTGNLLVNMIYYFLMGVSSRSANAT